jgi:hypothetical protein
LHSSYTSGIICLEKTFYILLILFSEVIMFRSFSISILVLSLLALSPSITQAQQGNVINCPQGQSPQQGSCLSINANSDARPFNNNSHFVGNLEAPNEKYAALALILEIFPSFGVGHYYAGNTMWGIAATVSNISIFMGLVMGMGSGGSDSDYSLPRTLAIMGVIGKVVTLFAAPIVTYNTNKEKRRNYNLMLQSKNRTSFLDLPFFHHSDNYAKNDTPYTSTRLKGKTLLFPLIHLNF